VARTGTLKPGWTLVKFGEVVKLNRDRSADPASEGLERYVGLEHIDPGDLRVRRWGLISEGTTFTSRFRPGQVLFGKRRAYQRKVAVANFDGVCSGDIYVLEPKDDKLWPELLPLICQSEDFYEYAVGTSAGSLSPRTNWKSLKDYEFPLPPLDEQRAIVEILRAADKSREALLDLGAKLDSLLTSEIHHVMAYGLAGGGGACEGAHRHPHGWSVNRLEDIATVDRGKFTHRPRNLPEFYGGDYPFVQTGDIASSGGLLTTHSQTLSEEGARFSRSFPEGTILMTIAAVIGYTAITTYETWCPDSVVGIIPKRGVDVRFLEYSLRTRQSYLERMVATQTAQKNINLAVLRPLGIAIPDLETQRRVVDRLSTFDQALTRTRGRVESARALRRILLGLAMSGAAN